MLNGNYSNSPSFTEKLKNASFETAVEKTGFGKYNIALILTCGLTLFAVNSECYTVGFVLPATECEWHLNPSSKGILTSANFVGIISTCFLWGYISDTYGRKNLLIASTSLMFVCSFASAFVTSYWVFVVLQLLKGICIAGPSAIVFTYFGEFQGENQRSRGISFISYLIAAAFIHMPAMAWLIIPSTINLNLFGFVFTSWRLFLLVSTIPTLVALFGLIHFPESPKFLYYNGEADKALKILSEMYANNTGGKKEDFPVQSLIEVGTERKGANFLGQILELVQAPYWKFTLAGFYMQAAASSVASGLLIWYPDIINQLSLNHGEDGGTICEAFSVNSNITSQEFVENCVTTDLDSAIFLQNMFVGLGLLINYSIWSFVVNLIGNVFFFNICVGICTIATLLVVFVRDQLIIDLLFLLILVPSGVSTSVIISMTVDVMPTHLSAMSVSLNQTACRFGGIISSSIFGILVQWSCVSTFSLYAAFLAGSLMLSIVFYKRKNSFK